MTLRSFSAFFIAFLCFICVVQTAFAQPAVGTTSFPDGSGLITSGSSPKSTTVSGYTFSIYGGGTVGITAVGRLRFDSDASGWTELRVASSDGSEFKLSNFTFSTNPGFIGKTVSITGYKDGVAVSGATMDHTATNAIDHNVDVSSNASFADIDEIRIAPTTAVGAAMFRFQEISIVVPPTITSFSPASGPAGTEVTIAGTNFSTTPASNTVFFGATKATVTAASTTSLTVTVPVGARLAPISVLNTGSGLTAISNKYYQPSFTPVKAFFGTSDLAAVQAFSTGNYSFGSAVGDLDGDGKTDIVALDLNNTLAIYLNSSTSGAITSGSFSNVQTLTTGTGAEEVVVGDFNGDGKPDIAVANSTANNVSVFLNQSSGTGNINFAAKADFTTDTKPVRLATGDIDGDGLLDIVTANNTANTISLLRNTSSGGSISFATHVDFAAQTGPQGVAIADMDNDNKLDIVAINYTSNSISVFRNTATVGAFTASSLASAQHFGVGGHPQSIAIADIDGDGKMDVATTYHAGSGIHFLPNASTGIGNISFGTAFGRAVGSSTYWIALGDLNGDGKPDIVTTDTFNIFVILNKTTPGNFTDADLGATTTFYVPGSPRVVLSDLDGDGKADIIGTNGAVSVFRNALAFPPVISSFTPSSGPAGTTVTITGTNFNTTAVNNVVFFGGIKASVTAANSTSLTVTVPSGVRYGEITVVNTSVGLTATSSKVFTPVLSNIKNTFAISDFSGSTQTTLSSPWSAAMGDIDGDGKADIVMGYNGSNKISVLRNTGTSGSISFDTKVDFTVGNSPNGIAIADIDGDGKLDISTANQSGGSVSVMLNTSTSGTISFAAASNFSLSFSGPIAIAVRDLDGDGRPDIATANLSGNNMSVLRNTGRVGSISFASAQNTATGTGATDITMGDIDGDGKADIAVANQTVGTVSVFLNTSTPGSITFAAKQDQTGLSGADGVIIGDVDGDGKADLVSANYNDNNISVFRNTGSSGTISFATKFDLATGNGTAYPAFGDFDGDGKADIAVAEYTANTVSLFHNKSTSGNLSFDTRVSLTTGTNPIFVATGDLNGDGKADIIVPNFTTGNLSVFKNNLPSTNAALSGLTVSDGTLSPVFGSGTLAYTASVPNATTSITLTPTVSDGTATIKVNTVTVLSGAASGSIALNAGTNTITTIVTAGDGTTTKTYTVTVTRAASDNATLTALVLSAGTLSPTFTGATLAYTATVPNATTSITLTPTRVEGTATIKVNTVTVASGAASGALALAVGPNTITTEVTAGDGTTTKTYTVTVTRAASDNATLSALALSAGTLSPTFTGATLAYTATVPNATTSITLTPTVTEGTATIKVNTVTVASAAASGSIALAVGSNTITIEVTAGDGTTIKTYTLTVTRAASADATLSAIALSTGTLSPTFAGATIAYTATVSNATTSITLTPTRTEGTATIKVNTVAVASGTASGAIALNVGSNTITTIVTAGDGTINTYSVTVTRAASAIANLSAFAISSGTLSPTFAAATTSYTATVASSVSNMTVTPTVDNAEATVKVNNTAVSSGSVSGSIALNVGVNTITTVVTAGDGTLKTYTLAVTRPSGVSSVANLSGLTLSAGTLNTTFAAATTAYTVSVPYSTSSLTLTPTVEQANATVKVNDAMLTSGSASGSIALNVGSNILTTIVTAQDGTTTTTYTITVTRAAAATIANLSGLTVSAGALNPTFAAAITSYTLFVNNNISTTAVTPTRDNAGATIKVNNTPVTSGTASGGIGLVVGVNTITTLVTAEDGTTPKTYTVKITRLEPEQILTDQSGNVTVSDLQKEVVITSPTQPITVTIPSGNTTTPIVDYGGLISAGTGTIPKTTISSPLVKVEIPASTTVTGSNSTWTGTISAPKISDYEFPKVKGQTITKGLVIEVGDQNVSLTFTKAVRLILYGQAGMRIARVHGGVYTEITTVGTADTQVAGDALNADQSFKINVGPDLVIWTKGFSQFITFTQDVDLNVALVAADMSELTSDRIKGANADLDHITAVLTNPLPATGSNSSAITWVSDKTGIVSNDGKTVNRPLFGAGNTTVTMTATLTKGDITETKAFTLAVLQQPNQAPTLTAIANQAAICFTGTTQTIKLAGITAGPESGQAVTVTATSSNSTLLSGLSITGTGATRTLSFSPADPLGATTTITVTVKDNGGTANGGSDTFTRTFTVIVNPLPVIAINSSLGTSVSKGLSTTLTASGGVTYTWANAAGIISGQNSSTLTVRPATTAVYTVTVTNGSGCTSTQSITIAVADDYKALDLPNILTPNGDGKNDALVIKNLDMYPNNILKIFDRSGRLIYSKQSYANDWAGTANGSPLPEDTYYYILDFGGGLGQLKGFVSIVR